MLPLPTWFEKLINRLRADEVESELQIDFEKRNYLLKVVPFDVRCIKIVRTAMALGEIKKCEIVSRGGAEKVLCIST